MIRRALRRVVALLVDDGWLALAVVTWLLLAAIFLPGRQRVWSGIALFAGLAGILLESTIRRARR